MLHLYDARSLAKVCNLLLLLLFHQVVIEPDQGQAQQSSMTGLQRYLIAGVPQQLAVTARDAQGNLTAGTDRVQVMLDSTAEGMPEL